MKGIKGTVKTVGDPCADCKRPLTKRNGVPRASPREGLLSYCRRCMNQRNRTRDPAAHRERCRAYRRRLREEALKAYGGKCACCGETTPEFLALDHIQGGGGKERRALAGNTSSGMYRLAKKLGWPTDRYRLLCHNCNCAMGWYGRCPHQSP